MKAEAPARGDFRPTGRKQGWAQPPNLSFADHIHRLVSCNCVQRAIYGAEPQACGYSLLDEAVVLFKNAFAAPLDNAPRVRLRFHNLFEQISQFLGKRPRP